MIFGGESSLRHEFDFKISNSPSIFLFKLHFDCSEQTNINCSNLFQKFYSTFYNIEKSWISLDMTFFKLKEKLVSKINKNSIESNGTFTFKLDEENQKNINSYFPSREIDLIINMKSFTHFTQESNYSEIDKTNNVSSKKIFLISKNTLKNHLNNAYNSTQSIVNHFLTKHKNSKTEIYSDDMIENFRELFQLNKKNKNTDLKKLILLLEKNKTKFHQKKIDINNQRLDKKIYTMLKQIMEIFIGKKILRGYPVEYLSKDKRIEMMNMSIEKFLENYMITTRSTNLSRYNFQDIIVNTSKSRFKKVFLSLPLLEFLKFYIFNLSEDLVKQLVILTRDYIEYKIYITRIIKRLFKIMSI